MGRLLETRLIEARLTEARSTILHTGYLIQLPGKNCSDMKKEFVLPDIENADWKGWSA